MQLSIRVDEEIEKASIEGLKEELQAVLHCEG